MKPSRFPRRQKVVLAAAISALFPCLQLSAATVVWDGGGQNDNWSTGRNWAGDTVPAPNDALQFDGFARLTPTNDFAANTVFNGLTFNATAGAFTVSGSAITLGGGIVDNTAVVTQTINHPLVLSGTRNIAVTSGGFLVLGGTISGASAGLTKTGSGQLTLGGNNGFSGPLVINDGKVSVSSDGNLGAAPATATAGQLVIDGGGTGTLRTTANFTINANRGISVGPSSGTGSGTIDVTTGTIVTYGGIIANNGAGTGGLTKSSFGGLTLSGANTYTGPTIVQVGTLTLDFTQPTSPASNIISSSSALKLGGSNAGLGGTSFAALTMTGSGSANTQTFNGTTIDIGPAIVRANSGSGGSATLNLGALTHNAGGVVNLVRPTTGNINTTTPNTNGIIGGWATVGAGTQVTGITVGNEWAAVDGSGNIVPYAGHLNYATGTNIGLLPGYTSGANLRINNASSGSITVADPNAGTTTDINTIQFSEASGRSLVIGAANTLRLGKSGGIFRSDATTAAITWAIGTSTGGANGVQNEGTLTAGGAPDTSGEIVFTINAPSQTAGSLNVEVKITDNGTGAVSVVKAGPGSMKFRGNNTYSGGTYILQGRFQLAGSEIGVANPDGFGTGPIFVMPGGQAFPSGAGTTAITNAWFIAGNGISDNVGAIRLSSGGELSGTITLIGDTRLGGGGVSSATGGGGRITGKITGPFNLDFGAVGNSGGGGNVAIISNPANDWTGNTAIVGRTGGTAGNTRLVLGANEVIPNGVGKGNLIIGNSGNTASTTTFDLNGFNETINGLSSAGNATLGFVQNGAAVTTSTLTVGDYDQTSTFAGVIQDGAGIIALTKIGSGILTLSGANTYTGETNINAGTLSITGTGAALSATGAVKVNSTATSAGILSGTGAVGTVTLAANIGLQIATIAPGATSASGTIGTLPMSSLVVGGGNLQFDLVSPGASDFIDITGTASFNAASTISPGPLGAAGTYTLLTAAGGITLTVPPTINVPANSRSTFTLDTASAPNSIKLVVAGGPKTIIWTGATNSTWDVVNTTNWTDGAIPEKFFTGDSVTFTDAGANRNINLPVSVLAGGVTVNNSVGNDYTFGGGGSIDGGASFTKSGTGRLVIATTNSYTGPTTITGGIVEVGAGGAAGSLGTGAIANEGQLIFNRGDSFTAPNVISGAGQLRKNGSGTLTLSGTNTYTGLTSITDGTVRVTNATFDGSSGSSSLGDTSFLGGIVNISAGAALDLSGSPTAQALNFGAKQFNIAGVGVGGTGVLTNSGTVGQNNAFQHVTLTADAAVGGTGRFDIRGAGSNLDLAGFTLTKRGTNQVSLVDTIVTDGNIVVEQGLFAIEAGTTIPASPSGKITYNNGTTAQFFNLAGGVARQFVLNGNVTMGNASAQISTLNSDISLNGDLTVTNLNNSTGPLILVGNIIETGGARALTKMGGTILSLQGNNAYSGATNLNGGLVEFINLSNLGTNPTINFSGGGLLYSSFAANPTDLSTRTLTFNTGGGTIDTSVFDVTFANPIGNNGVGGFTKAGAGTLTFTTANTYGGPTNINGGSIQFSSLNQLGTGTAISFGGGTLRYASDAGNIDITSRAVTLNANGGRIDTNGNNVTFGGSISGIGGFEKVGAGTLTLMGDSTYTGGTTVSEGTLLVNGSLAGAVNVLSGTLQLGANERFLDTATVMFGSGVFDTKGFDETLGVLSVTGSATLELGLTGSVVRFADSTSTFWTGLLSITNWSGSPGGGGTDQVFFGGSEFALTVDQIAAIRFVDPFGPGTGSAAAQMLPTGEIVAIPEPSALTALLGGLGMLSLRRRRNGHAVDSNNVSPGSGAARAQPRSR